MDDQNEYFRNEYRKRFPSTDGIPNHFLLTVRIFRAAFPAGVKIDSDDCNAICVFLDREGWPHRAIARALDFTFDLGYRDVLNSIGYIEDDDLRERAFLRIEKLLPPLDLNAWRAESD